MAYDDAPYTNRHSLEHSPETVSQNPTVSYLTFDRKETASDRASLNRLAARLAFAKSIPEQQATRTTRSTDRSPSTSVLDPISQPTTSIVNLIFKRPTLSSGFDQCERHQAKKRPIAIGTPRGIKEKRSCFEQLQSRGRLSVPR